MRLNTKMVIY